MAGIKTITVRLPNDLYSLSTKVARKRHVSFNAYVQESLGQALKLDEDQALYEAFGRFGQDKAATDVSFASAAQKEALPQDEPPPTR